MLCLHSYLSNNSILSLDDFEFPASLLTLCVRLLFFHLYLRACCEVFDFNFLLFFICSRDLTNNLIASIENVSFPANLAMLYVFFLSLHYHLFIIASCFEEE